MLERKSECNSNNCVGACMRECVRMCISGEWKTDTLAQV